jgi:hypothetical protein
MQVSDVLTCQHRFPQPVSHSRKYGAEFRTGSRGAAKNAQRRLFSSCSSSVLQSMQRVVTGRAFSRG